MPYRRTGTTVATRLQRWADAVNLWAVIASETGSADGGGIYEWNQGERLCGLARASAQPRRHLERDFRTRPLDAGPYTVAAADALTTKVREGGRVNVHTSVATGVNTRAYTGSPLPIGTEPFRQGREHGHGRFWPLLKYGV